VKYNNFSFDLRDKGVQQWRSPSENSSSIERSGPLEHKYEKEKLICIISFKDLKHKDKKTLC
jgi:hypothetical protein